jgi:drug/metabolite transporter (DMT)-like permease
MLYTVDVQTFAIYSAILLNAAVWLFSTSPSSQRKEHGHRFILLRGFLEASRGLLLSLQVSYSPSKKSFLISSTSPSDTE